MNPALVPGPRALRRGALPRPAPLKSVAASPPVDVPEPVPSLVPPTAAEIAELAYALYVARGGEDGHDVEDWLEAERALTAARPAAAPTGGAA